MLLAPSSRKSKSYAFTLLAIDPFRCWILLSAHFFLFLALVVVFLLKPLLPEMEILSLKMFYTFAFVFLATKEQRHQQTFSNTNRAQNMGWLKDSLLGDLARDKPSPALWPRSISLNAMVSLGLMSYL